MSDEGWSNLDEVDQKIIAILNKNALNKYNSWKKMAS
jgi:hypothetical protein